MMPENDILSHRQDHAEGKERTLGTVTFREMTEETIFTLANSIASMLDKGEIRLIDISRISADQKKIEIFGSE